LAPYNLISISASSAANSARPFETSSDNFAILSRIVKTSNRILSTWLNIRVVTVDIEYISLSTSKAPVERDKHMEVKSVTCRVKLACDNAFSSMVSKNFNNPKGVQWGFAIAALSVSVSEQKVLGTKKKAWHVLECSAEN